MANHQPHRGCCYIRWYRCCQSIRRTRTIQGLVYRSRYCWRWNCRQGSLDKDQATTFFCRRWYLFQWVWKWGQIFFLPEKWLTHLDFQWNAVANTLSPRSITKLMCSHSADLQGSFRIFAATQANGAYVASAYAIDPSPAVNEPWKVLNLAAESNRIIEVKPVVFGGPHSDSKRSIGLAILHDVAPDGSTQQELSFNVMLLNDAHDESFINLSPSTKPVGKVSSFCTSVNMWKYVYH